MLFFTVYHSSRALTRKTSVTGHLACHGRSVTSLEVHVWRPEGRRELDLESARAAEAAASAAASAAAVVIFTDAADRTAIAAAVLMAAAVAFAHTADRTVVLAAMLVVVLALAADRVVFSTAAATAAASVAAVVVFTDAADSAIVPAARVAAGLGNEARERDAPDNTVIATHKKYLRKRCHRIFIP